MKKAYSIKYEERDGYLVALVTGEQDSVNASLSYAREIAEKCKEMNFQKVLVEENFKTQLSPVEMLKIAAELPAIAGNIKVAFIDRQLSHFRQNMAGLAVALQRGINARIFKDVEDAETWLLSEKRLVKQQAQDARKARL